MSWIRDIWVHVVRPWASMVREKGPRRGFAESLRYLADRIADEDAFTGGTGRIWLHDSGTWVYWDNPPASDRRGMAVWYRRSEYDGEAYSDDPIGG